MCLFNCSYGLCKSGTIKNISVSETVRDSVDGNGLKVKLFANDSIYRYDKDENLRSKHYLNPDSPIKRVLFYTNGVVEYIEYNPVFSEKSLIEEYFYNSGKIQFSIWAKDTVFTAAGNTIHSTRFYTSYYENGCIQEYAHQGIFRGVGTTVSTVTKQDSLGTIVKTIHCIYPKQTDEEVEQDGVFTYVVESEYDQNGQPKWEKVFTNYFYYEIDETEKQPTGTWRYHDSEGNLISEKIYNNYVQNEPVEIK